MPRPRRRLTRRQRDRWFFMRYDTLRLEGFTPEESNYLAGFKISTNAMRRIRYRRKRELQREIDRGLAFWDAVEVVRQRWRDEDKEILIFADFVEEAYFVPTR